MTNQLLRRLAIEPPSSNGHSDTMTPQEFFAQNYISKLKAKTDGQQDFIEALDKSIVTLCHGPSGTGKTYIAVGKSIEWLYNKRVDKIIICRPAVECGAKLGFLPGDVQEKIEPYMRPVVEKFYKFIDKKDFEKFIKEDKIELLALSHMRGMSLDRTCIILDEAQNALYNEILMFLTRLGEASFAIICGDTDQTDLPTAVAHAYHEFIHESKRPPYIDGFDVVELTEADVVRSKIVQAIVKKYTKR